MSQPSDAEVEGTHYLVCSCGFDPWKSLSTDNSGPDEDSARIALGVHLREHNRRLIGRRLFMSNSSTPAADLAELARGAAWGLAKGGHLDSWEDGKAALFIRLDILEAAERAGIHVDLKGEGIGSIYTRAEVNALV